MTEKFVLVRWIEGKYISEVELNLLELRLVVQALQYQAVRHESSAKRKEFLALYKKINHIQNK